MLKRQFLYVLSAIPAILCLMPSAAYAEWEWRSENELTCELQPQMLESWNGAATYGQVQVCNVQPVLRWEYVPDAAPNDSVTPVSPPPNPSSSLSDSSSSHQQNSPDLSSGIDNVVNDTVEDLLQDIAPEGH